MDDHDRTASLMTPAKLAQVKPRAAVNPAAFLDQMAADAGHAHVRRLGELRIALQEQAAQRSHDEVSGDLAQVAETLPRLDFGLLQAKGWLARLSGKARTATAGFAGQHARIEQALDSLADGVKALQKKHGGQLSGTDLALLEFEVEFRGLEKIIDQGARWLQDMRGQLKAREAAATTDDERRRIAADAQRCEILVARLKALRSLSTAAQQVHQQAQSAAARRAGLVQVLQQAIASDVREWRGRLQPLASAAADGEMPTLSLEGPMESHRDLQLCVKQAIADCAQVQSHEKALADGLAALAAQLQAAA